MKVAAVIPARAGSKGISHKNLRDLAGKPLIAWTIEAVLACMNIDRVIVSTDSQEIANVACHYGAEVPFIRPAELARDETPSISTVVHAVEWVEKNEGYWADCVMCLQPTSPLCATQDIQGTLDLLNIQDAEGVVSVTASEAHPYWMKQLDHEGRLTDFLPPPSSVHRRQDLPQLYSLNGAIYMAKRDILVDRRTWYTPRTFGYIMPTDRSLDINTPWDLYLAELILKDKQRNSEKAASVPRETVHA